MEARGGALVTGASRGIGRATALELARRGFDVVAGVRRESDAIEVAAAASARPLAGSLRAQHLDVTRPESIAIPDGLRVLVNNAGLDGRTLPVEHAAGADWRAIFETNFFGLLEVTRRAIPLLRASGGGVVCNLTSSSLFAPVPFFAAYRASKAAVSALGESLLAELAPFGIRVVEILPGPIATDMLAFSDRLPEAAAHPEYRAQAERMYAGRQGVAANVTSAEDAARAIVDVLLDDAAPLRNACDPLGEAMLAASRAGGDEELLTGMLSAFVSG